MGGWRSRQRYGWKYSRAAARPAKGGIKAQTTRGAFGTSWWGKRWTQVLESFNWTNRLDRGRAYARKGQVMSIRIERGRVSAEVQGTRSSPYHVAIRIETAQGVDRAELTRRLSEKAVYAAKLMAGEMPAELEQVFEAAGIPLFPRKLSEIRSECSCPDTSNPCKHIAAVYYLIGEEFDRDPLLIFELRGIELRKILARLGTAGSGRRMARAAAATAALPADPALFWGSEVLFAPPKVDLRVPAVDASLAKQLGNLPFWRGEDRFIDALEDACKAASAAATVVLVRGVNEPPES